MNLAPGLRRFLANTGDIAATFSVPHEIVLVHSLALTSSLVGDFIALKAPGAKPVPAKFSLLVRTPETGLPPWMGRELDIITRHQTQFGGAPANPLFQPDFITGLRLQKKALLALGHSPLSMELRLIDRHLDTNRKRRCFRHLHTLTTGTPPPPKRAGNLVSFVAPGSTALRRILRSRNKTGGPASLMCMPLEVRANLITWLPVNDWPSIVKEAGQEFLSALGWIIQAPASSKLSDSALTDTDTATASIFKKLELYHLMGRLIAIETDAETLSLLGRQTEEARKLVSRLPTTQRAFALPDFHLALHLTTLLAVLCCEDSDERDFNREVLQCGRLGSALALWMVRQHLHHFRSAFPADAEGEFTSLDLRVLHLLASHPQSVRDLQRRMRAVNRESVLTSLKRSIDIGLAQATGDDHFVACPPPSPGRGVSEILSAFHPAILRRRFGG